MNKNIQINGDYLEGGGQIVRTALALSTILNKPFIVEKIRKGRPEQGLKQQHLYCVKALEELCNADVIGVELGSTCLEYSPNTLLPKNLNIDIGTAGSVTLILQAVLLPCLFAEKKIRIKIHGGTDTKWAMSFDYFKEVFVPQLRRYCNSIDTNLIRRGYYPRGNGQVEIIINPKSNIAKTSIPKLTLLEQGRLIYIKGISNASKDLQNSHVAERQASSAKSILRKFNCPINIQSLYSDTDSIGSEITLWAVFSEDTDDINYANPIILGSDALGEKGKMAEIVGTESAKKLEKEIISKAPVDSHLADNLIPIIGLFGGTIKVSEISNHTLTNIYVVERFLGKIFNVDTDNKIISSISANE